MKAFKRWIAAAMACVLAVSLSLPSGLAASPEEPFADFRIDAFQMDTLDRDITVRAYRQDGDYVGEEYTCKINRVTGDATFYIQPQADGVWVALDYLTDLDGDGILELGGLPEGSESPAWDSLTAQGALVLGGNEALTAGQPYILSAETLAGRFQETEESRAQEEEWDSYTRTLPLCRVTISRADPDDGQVYEQLYYLEIHGSILLPFDISPDQWYYSAVEYSLIQGYFSGIEDGRFGPDELLNRAQLAQVLWTMGGCLEAAEARFSDVAFDDWFCQAVSWCQQEGLISGYAGGNFDPYAPLTREQLASILHRYAQYTGASMRSGTDLSQYDDQEEISSWAYSSMQWAVTNRLLTADGGALRPLGPVTRAELAAALYAYDINLKNRNVW